jgi:Leucine-rich repeat (LRR) protein
MLSLKGKRIEQIPRALHKVPFDKITYIDIRGNEITVIEESVCKNLS